VLGTILLSVLAGHWRYAHMNAIRGDGVNPELLGMTKVASEDCNGPHFLDTKKPFLRWWAALKMKESQCPERVRVTPPA
jgi:hypothetical protein